MKMLLSSIFLFALLFSNFSFALECYAIINGKSETSEIVPVADVVIPENAEDGAVIWESITYTRTVRCNKAELDEYVYFYPFPGLKPEALPEGMSFGLVYNGEPHDVTSGSEKIKTDILVPANGENTGIINVKVYIKKTGKITGGFSGNLAIYQLDGQLGLNGSSDAKNFRFYLSNLSNIVTGDCSYTFNGLQNTRPITVNDDLISNGQTISSVGSASVSCTPANTLKNRTVHMDLYSKNSSNANLFGTDKNGLAYQLLIAGQNILPSTTSSNPGKVTFKLDANAAGNLNFDQKILLASENETWLYKNEAATAKSDNPNLVMKVNSFE